MCITICHMIPPSPPPPKYYMMCGGKLEPFIWLIVISYSNRNVWSFSSGAKFRVGKLDILRSCKQLNEPNATEPSCFFLGHSTFRPVSSLLGLLSGRRVAQRPRKKYKQTRHGGVKGEGALPPPLSAHTSGSDCM